MGLAYHLVLSLYRQYQKLRRQLTPRSSPATQSAAGQPTLEPFTEENKVILESFNMSENNSVFLVFISLDFKKLALIQVPLFKTRSIDWLVDMMEGTWEWKFGST
jgi:hypothetical protein